MKENTHFLKGVLLTAGLGLQGISISQGSYTAKVTGSADSYFKESENVHRSV